MVLQVLALPGGRAASHRAADRDRLGDASGRGPARAAAVGLALLVPGGLDRPGGAILLGALAGAPALLPAGARRPDEALGGEVGRDAGPAPSARREAVRVALALLGRATGAQALAWRATGLAAELGVADGVIGLTAVAVGTSPPELVTAVQAARRVEPDLIVGDLLGSRVVLLPLVLTG